MKTTHALRMTFLILLGLFGVKTWAQDPQRFFIQYQKSNAHLLKNISLPLSDNRLRLGAVIASPSQKDPDYFYHWTRDAGLTLLEIAQEYRETSSQPQKAKLETILKNWIQFEIHAQENALRASANLGEPKFTVQGDIYPYDWGRPQNDGPAIRALAMTHYAFSLLSEGQTDAVRTLYQAELPARTPIKRDLEFIAHHWNEKDFDLWEEVRGQHFFTRMAQRAALIQGSLLANKLNDPFAAQYYIQQSQLIEKVLNEHLDPEKLIVRPTLYPIGDTKNKTSHLDSAVILASLYFSQGDGIFDPSHPYIQRSAQKLEEAFNKLYSINWNSSTQGIAIGRYPEDIYDGVGFNGGNPWFLTTAAFAEYYCRLSLSDHGHRFLQRILLHTDQNGHLSEQINRTTGFEQGARDLTWSYVAYLRAIKACE